MLIVKVDNRYRITLPIEARRQLGIRVGDRLTVEADGGSLVLRRPLRPSERMRGIGLHWQDGSDPAARIHAQRLEWDTERGR